jgi:hypothetical protein
MSFPGTATYSGNTAIFTPAVPLAPNTLYTATVYRSNKLVCTALRVDYAWKFTTDH